MIKIKINIINQIIYSDIFKNKKNFYNFNNKFFYLYRMIKFI